MEQRKKEIAAVLCIGVVVLLLLAGYGVLLWSQGRVCGPGSLLAFVSLGIIAATILGFLVVLFRRIQEIRSDDGDHRNY